MKSGVWWKAGFGLIGILSLIWVIRFLTTSPPGTRMDNQGREHVSKEDVATFSYNSNPPTSGPHLETWVKPGIYAIPQSEGELIHSLEHGYVIIHYNCNALQKSDGRSQMSERYGRNALIPVAFADHPDDDGLPATHSAALESPEATQSGGVNQSEECKLLQSELEALARRKNLFKLIVVPRSGMDTRIALTSWAYIDTMNDVDTDRIEKFIDYHRDHGPEQTME